MPRTATDIGLLILIAIGFFFSWISGFSYGRYFVVVPLLLTAFAVSRGGPAILRASSFVAAILLFGLFSFALFETITLETGFLVEFVICMVAYTVSFVIQRRPHA